MDEIDLIHIKQHQEAVKMTPETKETITDYGCNCDCHLFLGGSGKPCPSCSAEFNEGRRQALAEVEKIIDKWTEDLDWEKTEGLTREEQKDFGRYNHCLSDKEIEELKQKIKAIEKK